MGVLRAYGFTGLWHSLCGEEYNKLHLQTVFVCFCLCGDSRRSYALYNENDPNKILKNDLASEFREAKEWQ